MKIKHGSRRTVFICKDRVFKIPSIRSWVSFVRGINENLEERYWYSSDGSRKRDPKRLWDESLPLAEIYWADRFGLIVCMERVDTSFLDTNGEIVSQKKEDVLKDMESIKSWAKGLGFYDDIKPENVGYRGDRMVLLDYGYFGGTPDWYIGN